jgi:S-adenosylmethionine hydrolase
MSIITLLTDYGTADSYVAEVKAVLLAGAPQAILVDVTHEVPPGDIRAGQYLLGRSWHRFASGTVHFVVVDPGVGTERRALAAADGGHLFVAPDNGLLSVLSVDARFVSIPVPGESAPTFHGRDVFAPAAARLATGSSLDALGTVVTDAYHSPLPTPSQERGGVVGEVIYVDRFGNLITNIPGDQVSEAATILAGDQDVGELRRTFGAVGTGELVAYVGSGATVEIALRDGSAARRLGIGSGASIRAGSP